MAPLSEVILTSSSSSATASGSTTLHDFTTSLQLSTLKPSSPGPNSTAYIQTQYGQGGICATVMEGKPLMNVWAWQKVSENLAQIERERAQQGRRKEELRADLSSRLLPILSRSNSIRRSLSLRSSPASLSPLPRPTVLEELKQVISISGRSVSFPPRTLDLTFSLPSRLLLKLTLISSLTSTSSLPAFCSTPSTLTTEESTSSSSPRTVSV